MTPRAAGRKCLTCSRFNERGRGNVTPIDGRTVPSFENADQVESVLAADAHVDEAEADLPRDDGPTLALDAWQNEREGDAPSAKPYLPGADASVPWRDARAAGSER
jgi:hypothetical protein